MTRPDPTALLAGLTYGVTCEGCGRGADADRGLVEVLNGELFHRRCAPRHWIPENGDRP